MGPRGEEPEQDQGDAGVSRHGKLRKRDKLLDDTVALIVGRAIPEV